VGSLPVCCLQFVAHKLQGSWAMNLVDESKDLLARIQKLTCRFTEHRKNWFVFGIKSKI
jgi:hypothetical protein